MSELFNKLKELEDNIIPRFHDTLNDKIKDITETALQEVHDDINKNSEEISKINANISPMKDNIENTMIEVSIINEKIQDSDQRLNTCEKAHQLSVHRFTSIEQELDSKISEMSYSDKRRVKNLF